MRLLTDTGARSIVEWYHGERIVRWDVTGMDAVAFGRVQGDALALLRRPGPAFLSFPLPSPAREATREVPRAAPACSKCHHGRRSDVSDTGWECAVERAAGCVPHASARFYVPKEA